MYLTFYGLTEKPFNTTPDPRFLYMTPCWLSSCMASKSVRALSCWPCHGPRERVPDCRVIEKWVDGFLIVTANRTTRKLLEEALHITEPAKVVGLVGFQLRRSPPLEGLVQLLRRGAIRRPERIRIAASRVFEPPQNAQEMDRLRRLTSGHAS